VADWITALPKAELHLHLEGSLEAATILEIAPETMPGEVAARYQGGSFAAFIESYKWVVGLLRNPADYALVARHLFACLHAGNVRYAEVTLSAGVVLWKGLDFRAVFEAVAAEGAASPVRIRWVLDAIRHFGPDHVMQVARLAAGCKDHGVVAFGIGGDEQRGPVECFGEAFDLARDAGLKLVPHAGETAGPESVWAALRMGAHRIGHGIAAIGDPRLMAYLRENDIPLEICISSNVATGVVPSITEHPVRRLYDAGVPIVLNTDDPAIFKTSLSGEYRLAVEAFGFTRPEIEGLSRNAFRYAGCDSGRAGE
jgi:adenosine deaminase/aminodeoxyfutalosine deaminase